MKRFIKRIRAGITANASYDNVEGLTLTNGVVAAFIMSFMVALDHELTADQFRNWDFRLLLCCNPSFREFTLHVMETLDIGIYAAQHFNFSVTIGVGKVLNITNVLSNDNMNELVSKSWWAEDCAYKKSVQTAADALLRYFPVELMDAWIRDQDDAWDCSSSPVSYGNGRNLPGYHLGNIQILSTLAIFSSALALLLSMLLYISLASTPCRADTTGMSLYRWLWVGGPLIALDYIFLLIGVILFFLSHHWMKMGVSKMPHTDDGYSFMIWVECLIPVFVTMCVLAISSAVLSLRSTFSCRRCTWKTVEGEQWRNWAPKEVKEFFERCGFDEHGSAFQEHGIDGMALPDLDEEHLEKMDINPLGNRLRVLRHIKDLQHGGIWQDNVAVRASQKVQLRGSMIRYTDTE